MTAVAVPLPAAVRAAACPADQLPQVVRALLVELVEAVGPARSAAVLTVSGPRVRPWASSGPAADGLEHLQAGAGQGPAFVAADAELVVSDDLGADPRWALAVAPGTSLVAVALPGAPGTRAVLVVRGAGPELTDPVVVGQVGGAALDLAAAVAVVQARVEATNLQLAPASNRTIGAAIGVTMGARGLPYDAAAAMLRSLSNSTNTRLVDLAEQVLLTGEVPEPPSTALPRPRRPDGAAGGR